MIFSFDGCEFLLSKYAGRFSSFDFERKSTPARERTWKQGPYKKPYPEELRAEMKRLRAQGMTVGDIARKCGVTYETARRHSKIGGGK